MNKQTGRFKKRIASITLAMTLCLSLIVGMAVTEPAYAFTGNSPFIGGAYNHNARFTGNVVANGVDVSWWQSDKSNWSQAKAAGVDYTIIRVTYTGTSPKNFKMAVDSRFANHYSKAKAAGVMTGVYVFSQAKNADEGRKEAQFAVARLKALGIGPKDLDLPVYFDYEFNSRLTAKNLTKANGTAAANAFCSVIRSNGYQPGIYANLTFFRNYLDVSKIGNDVDMWCAQYYSSCGLGSRYSKWQYTSSGKINGILNSVGLWKSSVDCNFWYLDPRSQLSSGAVVSGGTGTFDYTGGPIKPGVKVTRGGSTLREGVDYKVGYLNNVKPGTAYVYVKGIGSYSGYKLVPFTIKGVNKTTSTAAAVKFKKGKTYKVTAELKMRKGPGTKYAQVKRSSLSKSMKKKTFKVKYAVIRPGKKVKCKKVSGDWIKVSGGWICCKMGNEVYVK